MTARLPLLAAALAVAWSAPAVAQAPLPPAPPSPPSPASPAPPPRVADAAPDPGSWVRGSDTPWAGAVAAGLLLAATGPGLDEDVARETSPDPDGLGGAVADGGDVAGSVWLDYGAVAGTWAVSRLGGWPEAGRVALRSLASLLVADAATLGLKVTLGRGRPAGEPLDADRFDPFSVDEEHRSLPSGHAGRLFALASTLSRELGDEAPWLPWVAYPAAGVAGAGRVLEREHWVTDVAAGAALGILASRVAGRIDLGAGGEGDGSGGSAASVRLVAGRAGDGVLLGVGVALP